MSDGGASDVDVGTEVLLLEVLRERCGLTGTREVRSIGVCGACSDIRIALDPPFCERPQPAARAG